jgi:hypothetical protein
MLFCSEKDREHKTGAVASPPPIRVQTVRRIPSVLALDADAGVGGKNHDDDEVAFQSDSSPAAAPSVSKRGRRSPSSAFLWGRNHKTRSRDHLGQAAATAAEERQQLEKAKQLSLRDHRRGTGRPSCGRNPVHSVRKKQVRKHALQIHNTPAVWCGGPLC